MSMNHTCKKCNQNFILTSSNYFESKTYFRGMHSSVYDFALNKGPDSDFFKDYSPLSISKIGTYSEIRFFICPDESCNFVEVLFIPLGSAFENKSPISIQPGSFDLDLPVELNNSLIRNDLKEAFSIHQLSPRASIVLSRRALHSMLRDIFKITKNNDLNTDISNLKTINDINLVGPNDIDTLHKIRKIGNDGAHGPLDISSQAKVSADDAKLVIDFILSFVQKWYVYPEQERVRLENLAALHTKIS